MAGMFRSYCFLMIHSFGFTMPINSNIRNISTFTRTLSEAQRSSAVGVKKNANGLERINTVKNNQMLPAKPSHFESVHTQARPVSFASDRLASYHSPSGGVGHNATSLSRNMPLFPRAHVSPTDVSPPKDRSVSFPSSHPEPSLMDTLMASSVSSRAALSVKNEVSTTGNNPSQAGPLSVVRQFFSALFSRYQNKGDENPKEMETTTFTMPRASFDPSTLNPINNKTNVAAVAPGLSLLADVDQDGSKFRVATNKRPTPVDSLATYSTIKKNA